MDILRICAITTLLTFAASVDLGAVPITGDGGKLAGGVGRRSGVLPQNGESAESGGTGDRPPRGIAPSLAPAHPRFFVEAPSMHEGPDRADTPLTPTGAEPVRPEQSFATNQAESVAGENAETVHSVDQSNPDGSPIKGVTPFPAKGTSEESADSGDSRTELKAWIAPPSEPGVSPKHALPSDRAFGASASDMTKSGSDAPGSSMPTPSAALEPERYLGGSGQNEYVFVLDFLCPSCALYLPIIEGLLQAGDGRVAVRHAPNSFQGVSLALVYEAVLRVSPKMALEFLKWTYGLPLEQRQNPTSVHSWFSNRGPDLDATKIALLVGAPEVQRAVTDDLEYVTTLGLKGVPALVVNGVVHQ